MSRPVPVLRCIGSRRLITEFLLHQYVLVFHVDDEPLIERAGVLASLVAASSVSGGATVAPA